MILATIRINYSLADRHKKTSAFQQKSFWDYPFSRKEGDSNPRYPNRGRQFSKLVVSATHPSFLTDLR